MKEVSTSDVFTPSSPAGLTYIDRRQEEKMFKRAIATKGKQIVMYGHTGSGKTTLLYNLLSQLNIKKITTRCTKGISIQDVIYDAFHQLGAFYIDVKEKSKGEKIKTEMKLGVSFFSTLFGGEASETEKEIKKRIVDVQKNPNQLGALFGAAEHVWVIEDFHKLDIEPKKELSQIMKVFMDVSQEYPKVKIIAVGAVDSARQVVNYDKEMEDRVSEINIPLMDSESLRQIINVGEKFLNITFEDSVKEKIVAYSSELASVTHQLCSLCCENREIGKTQVIRKLIVEDDLDYAVHEYVNEKSDSLKAIYEMATKLTVKRTNDTPEKILEAILRTGKDSFSIPEISTEMNKLIVNYKGNNLRKYVAELSNPERGEVLRYNRNADKFSFSSPFLRGYCHIHLIKYPNRKRTIQSDDVDLLKAYLTEEYRKFLRELQEGEEDQ